MVGEKFNALEMVHIGGSMWGTCGELCMMRPPHALRQYLYWLKKGIWMGRNGGETQNWVSYLIPTLQNGKIQLDFQILPISTLVTHWWHHHDITYMPVLWVFWKKFVYAINVHKQQQFSWLISDNLLVPMFVSVILLTLQISSGRLIESRAWRGSALQTEIFQWICSGV